MSEEKQPQPQLTAQEQQQQSEAADIEAQFGATDMLERVNDIFPFFGFGNGQSVFGKTNFEGAQLNAMLDLLESAKPEDLADAGEALVGAKEALNAAAKELSAFISETASKWEGEGATEFRRYGGELVKYAWELGGFANAIGTQMGVASTGLASVRNSKPPRDGRLVQKKPEDFPMPERTEGNADYQKALQVEKDRQEAINQMNRLASFYAVSEGTLASQEPPKLPKSLNAAVPRPTRGTRNVVTDPAETLDRTSSAEAQAVADRQVARSDGSNTHPADRTGVAVQPTPVDTSVQIDSVQTPTAPPTTPATPTAPSATGTPNPTVPVPPMTGGPGFPPARATGRPGVGRSTSQGQSGVGRAAGQGQSGVGRAAGQGQSGVGRAAGQGQPGVGRAAGQGQSGVGRATGQGQPGVGRATGQGQTGAGRANTGPMGRPSGTGPTGPAAGRAGTQSQSQPMAGRPGMTGQPAAGRGGAGSAAQGGGSGIVGGTPQRPVSASGTGRIPRGTVVGGEGAGQGRAQSARPSQSGVVGAGPANGARPPVGRGTPSANGVVGTPRNAGRNARPASGGYTTGGAPIVGGRRDQCKPEADEQEQTSVRPDYQTEDEETWAARRRGPVPPVID